MMVGLIFVAATGLILGSFVNALEWRLRRSRRKQGIDSYTADTDVPRTAAGRLWAALRSAPEELLDWLLSPWRAAKWINQQYDAKPDRYSIASGRSMCPHCKHQLAGRDLIPVASWLWLRGRCRYCHKPIGWQYPVVEVLTATLFVVSYLAWPGSLEGLDIAVFGVWLAIVVAFVVAGLYDAKWHNLPSGTLHLIAWLAIVQLALRSWGQGSEAWLMAAAGAIVIWGLFFMIYCIGETFDRPLIGYGDVRLAAPLGLLAGGPLEAMVVLFVASLFGSLWAGFLLATKRADRGSHIPYGPFLLAATVLVYLAADHVRLGLERALGLA